MSSDLTVQAVVTVRVGNDVIGEPKVAAPPPPPPLERAPASSPQPNPSQRLDLALGLVVIEFHNGDGSVTTSIPSQRQLDAYRRWETPRFDPAPASTVAEKPAPQPQPQRGSAGSAGSAGSGTSTAHSSTASRAHSTAHPK